jgi:hypothetical protein
MEHLATLAFCRRYIEAECRKGRLLSSDDF